MMLSNDELVELIDGLAGLPYGGEAVDERRHALQCAEHAVAAVADDELVVAAALHDIGRAAPVRAKFPGLPHEEAGAAFARERIGEGVAWLIAQHVPAKRYLVAVDEAYLGQLSPVSVLSLQEQGGPMNAAEVRQFGSHPRAEAAVALRRWDEAAKDPAGAGLPIADLLHIFDRYRLAQGRALQLIGDIKCPSGGSKYRLWPVFRDGNEPRAAKPGES